MSPNTVSCDSRARVRGLPPASGAAETDWPTYNRTLTSERFAALDTINTKMSRNSGSCVATTRANRVGFRPPRAGRRRTVRDDRARYPLDRSEYLRAELARSRGFRLRRASGSTVASPGLKARVARSGNSPAYDPALNLIFTGEVDWCVTVHASPAMRSRRRQWTAPGAAHRTASARRTTPRTGPGG